MGWEEKTELKEIQLDYPFPIPSLDTFKTVRPFVLTSKSVRKGKGNNSSAFDSKETESEWVWGHHSTS